MSDSVTMWLDWGQDLILAPTGTFVTASSWDLVRQRIIRRILTNSSETLPDGTYTPPDYIFHITYGFGGGSLIGQNPTDEWLATFQQRVSGACLADVAIDPTYPPQVSVVARGDNTIWVYVGVRTIYDPSAQYFTLTLGTPR